jgi:hypothetical protein
MHQRVLHLFATIAIVAVGQGKHLEIELVDTIGAVRVILHQLEYLSFELHELVHDSLVYLFGEVERQGGY